ncbi:MAG TPA: hypothetical protein V6D03_13700, partial [Candidatus Caenarcaniphilales bacterium]
MTVPALLLATAFVGGGAWLGTQAMLNPDVAFWLNQSLSASSQLTARGKDHPHTLAEIQASIRQAGQFPGEVLTAWQSSSAREVLVPVFNQAAECEASCRYLVELRVYRSLKLPRLLQLLQSQQYFWLVDQMAVAGPQESQMIVPIGNQNLVTYGSERALPLTTVNLDDQAPASGTWLKLVGFLTQG